jgi:hypothetical protein
MSYNRLTIKVRRIIVAEAHGSIGVFVLGLTFGVTAALVGFGLIRGHLHLF